MSEVLLMKILNPARDYVPKSRSGELEDFMEGPIYEDFLAELNLRIENMRDFMETGSKDMYEETMGGIAAMRLVAGIFTDLYNNSIEGKDNGRRD